MAIVTIARQVGAGGDIVAARVAEGLGYDLVDSALIARVAEQAGVSVEQVMNLDEKYNSRAVEWLLNFITPRVGKIILEEDRHLNPDRYMEYVRDVVQGLADKGNMIIVGRGGQFILRSRENAFHVRLVADPEVRVEWMRRYYDITDREAADRIKRSDSMRANFIARNFKGNWEDPAAYHAVLNTAKLGFEDTAAMIIDAVKRFSIGREYIPGIRDRRGSENRRRGDRRRGDRRSSVSIWTIREVERALLRDGRPIRSLSRPDRRQGERRQHDRRIEDRTKP